MIHLYPNQFHTKPTFHTPKHFEMKMTDRVVGLGSPGVANDGDGEAKGIAKMKVTLLTFQTPSPGVATNINDNSSYHTNDNLHVHITL